MGQAFSASISVFPRHVTIRQCPVSFNCIPWDGQWASYKPKLHKDRVASHHDKTQDSPFVYTRWQVKRFLFLSFRHVLNVICSFWVIPRRLSSNCRRFGTHCQFHLHRQVNEVFFIHLPMKMEPTVSSETSAIRTQAPGNYKWMKYSSFTYLWRWNRQWVPKRPQLELRRRGITQKGTNYKSQDA